MYGGDSRKKKFFNQKLRALPPNLHLVFLLQASEWSHVFNVKDILAQGLHEGMKV